MKGTDSTMKYATAGIAAVLLSNLFGFSAGAELAEKPDHKCTTTNAAPDLLIGGFNVKTSNYGPFASENQRAKGGTKATNSNNTAMKYIADLWRSEMNPNLLPGINSTLQGAAKFDPYTLDGLGGDELFGFERHKYNDDFFVFRGVGVASGANDTDSEISEDEGIYVTFGGIAVEQAFVGIRALFLDTNPDLAEIGLVTLYRNGVRLAAHATRNVTADGGSTDGQEYFEIISEVGPFDAMSFITYSHSLFNGSPELGRHDFYVEYIDLCYVAPPTPAPFSLPSFITGDPHIRSWGGELFDFHGVCDLVLLQNPDFRNGLGLDIHVRTKQLKQFSYVSSAALRIGDDILEVAGDDDVDTLYWLNKQGYKSADHGIIGFVSGYPLIYEEINSKQHKFTVKLGSDQAINVTIFKKIVRVDIVGATGESFGSSLGLLGSYGSGDRIARDKRTVLEDVNDFGQEWQVLPFEEMLFHKPEGPQAPEKCFIPMASSLRRRLAESDIGEEEAKIACAHVNEEEFDICVFDVMATGDESVVGAY